ncbi:MAG TPA: AprI/Inh family metalloprotease inhibitor [Rhizomicrobium sp.]|nr:AprI/Inh family metalloprotease inhibitor [Rhizomicrobium sp.]
MTKIGSLAIGAFLALSTVALARAEEPVTGVWKLSIGATDPCTLTLSSDAADPDAGAATPSTQCPGGLNSIGRWKQRGSSIQLLSPSGDMIAWLKEKNGSYQGSRLTDGQKLALDR